MKTVMLRLQSNTLTFSKKNTGQDNLFRAEFSVQLAEREGCVVAGKLTDLNLTS